MTDTEAMSKMKALEKRKSYLEMGGTFLRFVAQIRQSVIKSVHTLYGRLDFDILGELADAGANGWRG